MKTSEKGKRLIAEWEGTELEIYKDSAGYPTIGVGHLLTKDELASGKVLINGAPITYLKGITYDQAINLLEQDLQIAEGSVNTNSKVNLSQNQFDALVSFAFNVGIYAFKSSTLLKELNASNYESVPFQMRRWIKSGNRVIQGLVNRREKEIKLWNGLL